MITAILHSLPRAIALPAYVAHLPSFEEGSTASEEPRINHCGHHEWTPSRSNKFPLPPLSEQQRIVEILQEAEEIRRLRAEAEAKTAELIPADVSTEFFGDLIGTRESGACTSRGH